tara:strand:- start:490 stop:1212 length:723 start_codon:yes stop_codon:yes gene_type:complete
MEFTKNNETILIGVDEAGRGPLFGDVYTSAVILPNDSFDLTCLKDSKKFTSKKKIKEVYEYIKKQNTIYSVDSCSHEEIDTYNILQATQKSMHKSIRNVIKQYIDSLSSYSSDVFDNLFICVDGNYFNDFLYFHEDSFHKIKHQCFIKGDELYKSISAASILAKVERDLYIDTLLETYPDYEEKYKLSKNKGYGTKQHLDGIRLYGYSSHHRKSFKVKSINAQPEHISQAPSVSLTDAGS